jgi:hypothetical protein
MEGSRIELIPHLFTGTELNYLSRWYLNIDTRILGIAANAFLSNLNLEDAEIAQLHRIAINEGITNGIQRVGNNIRNLRLLKLYFRLERKTHPGGQVPLRYGAFVFVGRIHLSVG